MEKDPKDDISKKSLISMQDEAAELLSKLSEIEESDKVINLKIDTKGQKNEANNQLSEKIIDSLITYTTLSENPAPLPVSDQSGSLIKQKSLDSPNKKSLNEWDQFVGKQNKTQSKKKEFKFLNIKEGWPSKYWLFFESQSKYRSFIYGFITLSTAFHGDGWSLFGSSFFVFCILFFYEKKRRDGVWNRDYRKWVKNVNINVEFFAFTYFTGFIITHFREDPSGYIFLLALCWPCLILYWCSSNRKILAKIILSICSFLSVFAGILVLVMGLQGNSRWLNYQGVIKYREGANKDALIHYNDAIRNVSYTILPTAKSRIAIYYNNRSNAYAKLGKMSLAIKDTSIAYKFDPNDTERACRIKNLWSRYPSNSNFKPYINASIIKSKISPICR